MSKRELLEGNGCAGFFELSLGLLGSFLVGAFEDSLRSTVNQVLGFLEAEAGDATNFLDDVDLVSAGIREDDVELGLFFFSSSSRACTASNSSNSYRSSSGNAPLFFEKLGQ